MKSILKSLDSLQLRGRNSGHQMCNRFTRRHYYPDCKYLHHNNDNLWDMYFARSDLKQRSLPRIMLSFRNKTHIIESVNVVDIDALFQHSEFCFVSVWIISHSPCLAFFSQLVYDEHEMKRLTEKQHAHRLTFIVMFDALSFLMM